MLNRINGVPILTTQPEALILAKGEELRTNLDDRLEVMLDGGHFLQLDDVLEVDVVEIEEVVVKEDHSELHQNLLS